MNRAGTCKDQNRATITLIEGALIASFAMNANACYIYIRGEYIREKEVQNAIDEAYDAGLLGKNAAKSGWDFDLITPRGRGIFAVKKPIDQMKVKGMPR